MQTQPENEESLTKDIDVLRKALAGHKRSLVVMVAGSTEEWMGADRNREICAKLGTALAQLDVLLLTGGTTGVPQRVKSAFRKAGNQSFIRVLPKDVPLEQRHCEFVMGKDLAERRKVIAACADLMVVISGGPGTADEATLAHQHGAMVLLVPSTGGAAAGDKRVNFPKHASVYTWLANCFSPQERVKLTDPDASPHEVVDTLIRVIQQQCKVHQKYNAILNGKDAAA